MSNEVEFERRLKEELDVIKSKHSIKLGSPEMEAYLGAGYPDIGTRKHAIELIEARKASFASVPWEVEQRAIAFLEALDGKPSKK